MSIYNNNLLALQKADPKLAIQLSQITTNTKYEVFATTDFSDANILDITDKIFMYKKYPKEEIHEEYKSFMEKYKLYQVMYIYGIGNGYLLNLLLQNSLHNVIYIFEPEIELLYIALNLVNIAENITSKRVVLINSQNFSSVSFKSVAIEGNAILYLKAYDLILNTEFYDNYMDNMNHVNQEILKLFKYYLYATGNDINDELTGLDHFTKNLPVMLQNSSLENLIACGKNTETAIIVATGPSLAKQLPLLKNIQNSVTIFSVDASQPILEKEGILPDIVTSIERLEATAKFYETTSKGFQKNIVFALTSVVHPKLLQNIKAGQLQLSMRPVGDHYTYMEFDEYGYLGLGMSSANMAYELASEMNFKQIIIIGQDLAYGEDGKSHSKNHIFGEDEVKSKQSDDWIIGYGGEKKVKTTHVWKLFLNGYENIVNKNKNTKEFLTINATEGGARIHGTLELSFKESIKNYVDTKYIKERISLQKPSKEVYQKNLHLGMLKFGEAIKIGKKMYLNLEALLQVLTKVINRYKKFKMEDIHKHIKEQETKKLIKLIAKSRDLYYKKEFESFYKSIISPLVTHLEYDIAYWNVQIDTNKQQRIQKNWKMIVIHHEWAYRILVSIEAILKILESREKELKVAVEEVSKN